MKTTLSSRRHHYMARVSILLITAALVVGMVSCGDEAVPFSMPAVPQ
jgi:hypothetical protein